MLNSYLSIVASRCSVNSLLSQAIANSQGEDTGDSFTHVWAYFYLHSETESDPKPKT